MAARGELLPMPEFSVFADTQDEPVSVYKWLDWLEKQLPFPVHRVTYGKLSDSAQRVILSKKSGNWYCKGGIPMFQRGPDGKNSGILRRQCTSRFKIEPIQRFVRHKSKQEPSRFPAEQWIGISMDEAIRMKPSRVPFIENRWPLIEKKMTRKDCLEWAKAHKLPEPPRSACVYCPYHSDAEWERLRTQEPEEFQKAVELERVFRASWAEQNALVNADVYLHRSCVPLDQVNFESVSDKQATLDGFGNECEGMCGV